MPKGGPFLNALMTKPYDDARIHLFHGAHDPGKVRGTIEVKMILICGRRNRKKYDFYSCPL